MEYLTCDKCGDLLDTVYKIRVGQQREGELAGVATLCEECARDFREYKRRRHVRAPDFYPLPPMLCRTTCAGCRRTIMIEVKNKFPSRRRFCSEACRLRTQRIERAGRGGRGEWLRICQACGERFRAKRSDAKTCSAKCRKRLQRTTTRR